MFKALSIDARRCLTSMFSIDADFGIHLSVVYATIFSLESSLSTLATEIAREAVHVSVRQDGALSPVTSFQARRQPTIYRAEARPPIFPAIIPANCSQDDAWRSNAASRQFRSFPQRPHMYMAQREQVISFHARLHAKEPSQIRCQLKCLAYKDIKYEGKDGPQFSRTPWATWLPCPHAKVPHVPSASALSGTRAMFTSFVQQASPTRLHLASPSRAVQAG